MALREAVEMAKKGLSYAKRTKYKEALAYYNKAITLDPNYAEGLFLRASALIESGSAAGIARRRSRRSNPMR